MDWYYAWAALLIVVLLVGWVLTALTLPGNWLMVLAVAVFAFFFPEGEGLHGISWVVVGVLLLLAIAGELLEVAAAAIGAGKVGGSKRGAALAMVGSLVGAIVGIFVGLPIPFIGPLIGPLVFAGIGALVGAMLGEAWKGTDLESGWKIGQAAFWGRLLGSAAKAIVGSIILVVAAVAAIA
jgi:uncharacterized protein YqgC (DUF456 family)